MNYPDHLAASTREWRQRKRSEIRTLMADNNDLDRLILGCAYTPAHDEISQARSLLEIAKQKMSVKNWGR